MIWAMALPINGVDKEVAAPTRPSRKSVASVFFRCLRCPVKSFNELKLLSIAVTSGWFLR